MRSENRPYLPVVDALRGVAALLVVVYHAQAYLRPRPGRTPAFDATTDWTYSRNPLVTTVAEGHTGVALFLVLSGFILTTGSLERSVDTRAFYRNRALRVGPLYVLVLLLGVASDSGGFDLRGLLQTLLGFSTFAGGYLPGPFTNLTWTVSLELQFYLLFPLLLAGTRAGGPRFLVRLVVGLAVLRTLALASAAQPSIDQATYYSLAGRLDQLLVGMLAAVVLHRRREQLARWAAALVAGGTVAVLALLWAFNQAHGIAEPRLWRSLWVDVEALAWATVVLGLVVLAPQLRRLPARALVWVGVRSYSLYLLHLPVLFLLVRRGWLLEPTGAAFVDATVTGLAVALPLSLALAALTYATVERPFLALRRRDTALTPAPAPAAP